MTAQQANMIVDELRNIRMLLSVGRNEWIDTKGALMILRRRNRNTMSTIRQHFLKPNEWRRDGKYYEYKISALNTLRAQADEEKITLPK